MIYDQIPVLDDPATMFDVRGRVGLITGGAGKMGRQFANVLARAGAHVVIADLDGEVCETLAAELAEAHGTETMGLACDVAKAADVDALFAAIDERCGRLDFMIANVMAKPPGYYRPFETYPESAWDAVCAGNLKGAFLCAQRAAPLMKAGGGGSMVFVTSIYGLVAPNQAVYANCSPTANIYGDGARLNLPGVYCASKGGLAMFARYLATALAADGIRVNTLAPGGVYDGQEDAFHQEYVQRTPLGRMAVWSDFNGAILFLVSHASRYMTGANLSIDGGWTTW